MPARGLEFPAEDLPRGASIVRGVGFHAARWGLLLGVAVLAYLVLPPPAGLEYPALRPGEIADRDVVAPFRLIVLKDSAQLRRERAARAAEAIPVYRFDDTAFSAVIAAVPEAVAAIVEARADRPERARVSDEERRYLEAPGRRVAVARALEGFLRRELGQGVADAGVLLAEPSRRVAIVRDDAEVTRSRDSVATFADLLEGAEGVLPGGRAADRLFRRLVADIYRPTLVPDPAATERRREALRGTVDSIRLVVPPGAPIVRAGEPASAAAVEKLVALREAASRQAGEGALVRRVLAPVFYNILVLSAFWLLLLLYRQQTYERLREMAFLAALLGAVVVASALLAARFPGRPELFPIPFAAIVITLLYNGRVSIMAAATLAMLLGSQLALRHEHALFFGLVGGAAAALGVRTLRRRKYLFRTVGLVWAAYALAALTLGLMLEWTPRMMAASLLAGGASAVGSAALALLFLPLAEAATRITTDLSLLELADPSRPLLRRLAVEAPGTYAHSLMMANLCEAACNAIGANGLLARVGCYYHDIGKLKKPQYFVENQGYGPNPHDKLKPVQSAQIIRSHVRDGLELAEDARLPPVLRAFIPEHHGTTEIQYFLERARSRTPDETLDLADFRYPGPRPRSAETAVAMLADSAEAAIRVLDEPTPDRVRAAIDQLMGQRVAAGQLDDAPLSLRDIARIKDAFVQVMAGLHHNRIDYPAAAGGIRAEAFGDARS